MKNPHAEKEHHEKQMAAVAMIVETAIDRLVAELRPSYKGQELHAAMPYSITGNDAVLRPITGRGVLRGIAVRETSGVNPATVVLHYGADATGRVIFPITLAAGQSTSEWFTDEGIAVLDGIFVEITGTVDGAVFLRPGE